MSFEISLTDYSKISDNSKISAADSTKNQIDANTNKKTGKRAKKIM